MLILHPSASCDVCLEPYKPEDIQGPVPRPPCVIECGHVFCGRCINNLTRLACPLCRSPYDPLTIRRMHVDISTSDASPEDTEKGLLLNKMIAVVRDGAAGLEYQETIQKTTAWLRVRDLDEGWDVRAMYLLLTRYQDMHKEHQKAQFESHELVQECKGLRELLASQSDNARKELEDLRRELEDEKATASAVERSLRDHHARADVQWSRKYDLIMDEVRRLREEVKVISRARHNDNGSRAVAPQSSYLAIEGSDPDSVHDMDVSTEAADPEGDDNQKLGHFSPLPLSLSPFPMTLSTFSPLLKGSSEDDGRERAYSRGSRKNSAGERERANEPMDDVQSSTTQPLAIAPPTSLISRFYDTNPPEGSASLPHPAPASLLNRRAEKQRERTPRKHSYSSGRDGRVETLRAPRSNVLDDSLPVDSGDEAEWNARRRRQLDELFTDPVRNQPLPATPGVSKNESLDTAGEQSQSQSQSQQLPTQPPQPQQPASSRPPHAQRTTPPIYVNQTQTRSRNGSIYVEPQPVSTSTPPRTVYSSSSASSSSSITAPALVPPHRPKAISRASEAAEAFEVEKQRRKLEAARNTEGQAAAPAQAVPSLRESTNAYDGGLMRRVSLERRPSDRKPAIDSGGLRSRRLISPMES